MKNLNTTGNLIKEFKIEKIKENFKGHNIEVIYLIVETDEIYKFRLSKDIRQPNLDVIKTNLEEKLNNSIRNFDNFSVKKDLTTHIFKKQPF